MGKRPLLDLALVLFGLILTFGRNALGAEHKVSCPFEEDRYNAAAGRTLAIENYSFGQLYPSTFDGIMAALPHLNTFILRRTNVTEVSRATFAGLNGTKCLDLSKNSLVTLKRGAFEGLSELETLILSENSLTDILDSPFVDLPKLRVLDLSRNRLAIISLTTFTGLVSLEELHLQFNFIQSLHAHTFDELPNLRSLFLHKNPLVNENGALGNLSKLETAVLGYTYLTKIPQFSNSLKVLDMEGCQLSVLPFSSYHSTLHRLEQAWLSKNPLSCACNLSWLSLWANQSKALADYDHVTCASPVELMGTRLQDALNSMKCWETNDTRFRFGINGLNLSQIEADSESFWKAYNGYRSNASVSTTMLYIVLTIGILLH